MDIASRNQDRTRPFQPFIILEDDAKKYRKFPESIDIPDDADFILIGISRWGVVDPKNGALQNLICYDSTNDDLIRVYNMNSTHGIMICSVSGLLAFQKCMLEGYFKNICWDMFTSQVQPFYKVYAFKNPLVYQYWPLGGQEAATKFKICETKSIELNQSIINRENVSNKTVATVIPLKVWFYWHSAIIPPNMQANLDELKRGNPQFEYNVYDEQKTIAFLKEFFPKEVLMAYESFIPQSFKSDLFRYCILYVYGGIYLDIKVKCENNFKLFDLTDKEYFCSDGNFQGEDGKVHKSVTTGFIFSKRKTPFMLNCIIDIVYNVSMKIYGLSPWIVSGPQLLGINYEYVYGNTQLPLTHYGPMGSQRVVYREQTVFTFYKEYRNEQQTTNYKHYIDYWKEKNVYNPCEIDLVKIYNDKSWKQPFLDALKTILIRKNQIYTDEHSKPAVLEATASK